MWHCTDQISLLLVLFKLFGKLFLTNFNKTKAHQFDIRQKRATTEQVHRVVNTTQPHVKSTKHLGLLFDRILIWNQHNQSKSK